MNSCVLCLCLMSGVAGQAPEPAAPQILLPAPPPGIAPADFVHAFRPAPGNYEVVFLHPRTCCPVKACFCLPCGCPKVICRKHAIVFDYGDCRVVIRFSLIGSDVWVRYT
jgi:hypothetical protein